MKNEDQNNEYKTENVSKILKNQENEYLSVIDQCADDIFEWISLDDLVALNSTCKKLQQLTKNYFHRKYKMKFMKVGSIDGNEIHFRCRDRSVLNFIPFVRSLVVGPSIECFEYLNSKHTKDLVSISFYDIHIPAGATNAIAELIKNVEIIEFQYASFDGDFYDVLKFCSHIKQLTIKYDFEECTQTGNINQWLLNEYPTLEHFHWSLVPLPENLDKFFQLNPNIRSFNGSVYPAMTIIEFLINAGIKIDELHLEVILELHEEDHEGIAIIRKHLDILCERNQIKSLMLQFSWCHHLLDPNWRQLKYLHGAYVDFPHEAGATKALSSLVHLKLLVLGINTTMSHGKANILAKHLINLEEIYIQISSIHAIIPFMRHAKKLHKIYIYKISDKIEFDGRNKGVSSLNKIRKSLQNACKTTVLLPDKAYCEMKWQSTHLNYNLIEVKRSESHVPGHPFATTILRRDICELYESF